MKADNITRMQIVVVAIMLPFVFFFMGIILAMAWCSGKAAQLISWLEARHGAPG